MTFTLLLGGARSGKSTFAERAALAEASKEPPVLIATAQAFDDEMSERIAKHQSDRGDAWRTVETPLELAAAIRSLREGEVAVVDCLTLWLTNVMIADRDVEDAGADLLAALRSSTAKIWVVANEVGSGIVPENALARRFRDEAGRLHQRLAEEAESVLMIIAGLPLKLK